MSHRVPDDRRLHKARKPPAETTATIIGAVTDQSGGVLPGVAVTLRHVATGRSFEGVTSTDGGYLVTLLPIGGYELTFALSGFQPRTVRGVTLAVNDRVQIDATLETGGVSEVIEVTGRQLTQVVGDPQVEERFVKSVPYWFNPEAFAPPAAGRSVIRAARRSASLAATSGT